MVNVIDINLIVAPVFGTNCCILVAENGDALVVDPGAGVAAQVIAAVERGGWQVRAVTATHGHADHTWDAGQLCQHFNVPFLIHRGDAYRLADPIGTLQTDARPDQSVAVAIAQAVRAIGDADYQQPSNVITFGPPAAAVSDNTTTAPSHSPSFCADLAPTSATTDQSPPHNSAEPPPSFCAEQGGVAESRNKSAAVEFTNTTETGAKLTLGELQLDLIFAPGHTEGSTWFLTPDTALSGDVLFAGSIGRTDLPGGDIVIMNQTLRRLADTLPPNLKVIPGHGPSTTVARELATNPYWLAALHHG